MNKREWMLQAALVVIGTGREFDTDAIGTALSGTYDAIVAASGDEGWIEHRGEKPYPEGLVQVRIRGNPDQVGTPEDADVFVWEHDDGEQPWEIVAWRPAT